MSKNKKVILLNGISLKVLSLTSDYSAQLIMVSRTRIWRKFSLFPTMDSTGISVYPYLSLWKREKNLNNKGNY